MIPPKALYDYLIVGSGLFDPYLPMKHIKQEKDALS